MSTVHQIFLKDKSDSIRPGQENKKAKPRDIEANYDEYIKNSKRMGIRMGMDGIQALNLQIPKISEQMKEPSSSEGQITPKKPSLPRAPSLLEDIFLHDTGSARGSSKAGMQDVVIDNKGEIDKNLNLDSERDELRLNSEKPLNTQEIHLHSHEQEPSSSAGNYCCCLQKKKIHRNRINPDIMKTKPKWVKLLRRIYLATCFIELLKEIKETSQNKLKACEEQTSILMMSNGTYKASCEIDKMDPMLKGDNPIGRCVILPDSTFCRSWMILIFVLLIWTAVYLPYRLAFIDTASLPLYIMECSMDGLFLFDVGLNFLTAFYDESTLLVTDKKAIGLRYLKTWFAIDLISSLPLQVLESSMKMNKSVRLIRLQRIYRMAKIVKLMKMFNFKKQSAIYEKFLLQLKLHSGAVRLSGVLIVMLFFMHFFTCIWYFVAKFQGFQPECWVMQHGLMDESNYSKYLFSFYWVLQTSTTVGYGDMGANNDTERLLAIILMLFGVSFYSYTIGNLSSIFSTIDSKQMKLDSKILALNEFAVNLKMPTRLYFKILRILKRNADVSSFNFLDQESLLDELPSALKNEVLGITRNRILDSFNLFKSKPPQFMLDIIPEFRQISLARDEVIYRKGGFVEDIYFLLNGRVGFVTEDGS